MVIGESVRDVGVWFSGSRAAIRLSTACTRLCGRPKLLIVGVRERGEPDSAHSDVVQTVMSTQTGCRMCGGVRLFRTLLRVRRCVRHGVCRSEGPRGFGCGRPCLPKSGVHCNPRARTRDRRVDPRLVNVLRNGLWVAPPFRGYKYRWRRWRRCRTRLRPCRVGAPQLRVVVLVLILCHFELAGAKSDRRHAGSGLCPCTPAGGIPRRHRHGTDDHTQQYHGYSSLHTRCRSHDPSRASPKICCC